MGTAPPSVSSVRFHSCLREVTSCCTILSTTRFLFPDRNSMSSFRPGRGHSESRKSVFYTNEEWELLDPNPKDLEESMVQEERRKQAPEGNKGRTVPAA